MPTIPKPFVRHEARSAEGRHAVAAYAKAVGAMKGRPAHDPTSWTYQAAIHGTYLRPLQTEWRKCEHQSWYFLPWHRIYLYYFERIVRAAVRATGGPADWALPYWNYGLGGANASIPDAFRKPKNGDGSDNPLYVAERAPGINAGAKLPRNVISDDRALARPHYVGNAEFGGGRARPGTRFWGAPGVVENTPHNLVHSTIRGWMGDPETAAQDPIFWLHHANVDRIWAVWSAHAAHSNPEARKWTDQKFHFFDADGKEAAKSCGEVVDTVAHLGYAYDPDPAAIVASLVSPPPPPSPGAPPPPSEPKFVGASEERVPLVGRPVRVPVEIDPRARQEVLEASDPADPRRLYLNVEDVEGEADPGSAYGIYVDLPADPRPEDLDRRHVGNLSFFGIEKAAAVTEDDVHPHAMRVSVEVGDLIRILSEDPGWRREGLEVSFLPLSLEPPEDGEGSAAEIEQPGEHPPIHIGRVSLSIDA